MSGFSSAAQNFDVVLAFWRRLCYTVSGKEGVHMKSNRDKKKLGAWLSALVMAVLMGGYALFVLFILTLEPEAFFVCFPMLLVAIVPLAGIVGVLAALRQRLTEIDGGEEDEAAKY